MSAETTLHLKLLDIQQSLAVPKSSHNDFGGFYYRNIEDIETAVKPLLKRHSLTLRFEDTIVEVGSRLYVRASALLSDGQDTISVDGWAREPESKTKMDDAQVTGASSSYARKYAAGGLFLIDNTKDADSMSSAKKKAAQTSPASTIRFATVKQVDWLRDVAAKYVLASESIDEWIESVLTVKPYQVPIYKVKDAADKLHEVGTARSKSAQQTVDDTIIPVGTEPLKIEDLDY